jgi:hypothetical protein
MDLFQIDPTARQLPPNSASSRILLKVTAIVTFKIKEHNLLKTRFFQVGQFDDLSTHKFLRQPGAFVGDSPPIAVQ